MKKEKYLFTMTHEFEAFDNVDARVHILKFLDGKKLNDFDVDKKLQIIYKDKKPEGVPL
jgi:hypothetical protein